MPKMYLEHELIFISDHGKECSFCGISSFSHKHRPNTLPKDFDRLEVPTPPPVGPRPFGKTTAVLAEFYEACQKGKPAIFYTPKGNIYSQKAHDDAITKAKAEERAFVRKIAEQVYVDGPDWAEWCISDEEARERFNEEFDEAVRKVLINRNDL
jgi:hypothetical protein